MTSVLRARGSGVMAAGANVRGGGKEARGADRSRLHIGLTRGRPACPREDRDVSGVQRGTKEAGKRPRGEK